MSWMLLEGLFVIVGTVAWWIWDAHDEAIAVQRYRRRRRSSSVDGRPERLS